MRHQAGLPILLPIPSTLLLPGHEAQLDALIERSELAWQPTEDDDYPRQVYHAVTRGIIASALLRKVDPKGRSISVFFREEVAVLAGLNITLGGYSPPMPPE